ncbi:NERD domain-containing protein [Moritella viscosa]|uniref:DNA topoisomerase I n=1 Tax=Moritella viscosa TaxID=80854 RepID=A0ABY1HCQ2_9GAMM|nr:NERD domain-containing protein [Moritella viscosa]SGY86728.1 DNA topoisomerase I [Moritella viscosa]SGY90668.1 DNA topoisomerase I [Moritella viscosa]SHO25027.1 DNA topoisomerase I [Moritella viscosa]
MDSALLFSAVINAISQFWFVIPFVLLTILLRSPTIKGLIGEWYVNRKLVSALDNQQYELFKNVTLPTEDGTTQIDHILLSPFGLFVIETKNMQGWIFGSERQAKWTQQIYKHKTSFQNPLRQNYKHTETLRELLELPKEAVHSVIIFTARAEFKTTMPANVGYINQAIKFIKNHDQVYFTELQRIELAYKLAAKKLQPSIKTHVAHIKHVKEIIKDKEQMNKITNVELPESLCPRCNSELVPRKNRKTKESFIGCSSYPKCRYMSH